MDKRKLTIESELEELIESVPMEGIEKFFARFVILSKSEHKDPKR